MITVTLFRKPDCPACDRAEADLAELQNAVPHRLVTVDITGHPEFSQIPGNELPTIEVGPYRLKAPVGRTDLHVALAAARDRIARLERDGGADHAARMRRSETVSRADRFTYWLSHHYMLVFNLVVFLYVGIPFLAPVLYQAGATGPARLIYTAYSPLCHQLAFRSWFLFGEQAVYPRELAGVDGLRSYEDVTGSQQIDLAQARTFVGSPELGYKVALCERDTAIYGSIVLFGLIFAASGRRLKSLPWYLWLLLGIVPIAMDGFSQLPGLSTSQLPAWLPLRESTPALRVLSGTLFGFTTAWFGYPFVEDTMRDTRNLLARKFAQQDPTAGERRAP